MRLETRAVYTKAYYQFEVRERVVPDPGAGEVQLQITACSICRTDLSIAGKPDKNWSLFGQEISGVVTAVGKGVTRDAGVLCLASSPDVRAAKAPWSLGDKV